MTPPIASSASQTITAIVFGITATIISIVTVWQSYRAWKIWHDNRRTGEVENTESDIELGVRSNDQPSLTAPFELPAYPFFPVVAPVEAGPAPQPSHEARAEPSMVVPVGNQETSTTPNGIN